MSSTPEQPTGAQPSAPLTRRQLRELAEAEQAREATQAPAPSRRALREQAAAETGQFQVQEIAAGRQAAPIVAPPAVTGAMRAVDAHTGQLTPARPVSQVPAVPSPRQSAQVQTAQSPVRPTSPVRPSTPVRTSIPRTTAVPDLTPVAPQPAQQAPATGFSRVGVRESIAQVEAQNEPRTYPRMGTTPKPAVPLGQRTPLAQHQPVREQAPTPAPTRIPTQPATPPSNPAATPAPRPTQQAPYAPTGGNLWTPAGSDSGLFTPESAVPGIAAEMTAPMAPIAPDDVEPAAMTEFVTPGVEAHAPVDGPVVPLWGAVVSPAGPDAGLSPASAMAAPFEPLPGLGTGAQSTSSDEFDATEDEDDFDPDSGWSRYTPLHYAILVGLGLILGMLVWLLINTGPEPGDDVGNGASSHQTSSSHTQGEQWPQLSALSN